MAQLDLKALKQAREAAGLTQKTLSARAGVSYSTLTKLEQGQIPSPSISTVQRLARALGLGVADLLERSELKTTANPRIKFVYFDVGGVLVHWLPSLHAFAARIERPDNAVRAIFYEFNDIGCRGNMTLEELQLLIVLRLKVDFKGNRRREALRPWLEDMRPILPSHEFITSLSSHTRVGLLTNVFRGYYPAFFERGLVPNLSYKAVVKSCDISVIKPEPEIFTIAAQAARVEPAEILFIDDSQVNVNAARALGWQVEWFDELAPQKSIGSITRKHFS